MSAIAYEQFTCHPLLRSMSGYISLCEGLFVQICIDIHTTSTSSTSAIRLPLVPHLRYARVVSLPCTIRRRRRRHSELLIQGDVGRVSSTTLKVVGQVSGGKQKTALRPVTNSISTHLLPQITIITNGP